MSSVVSSLEMRIVEDVLGMHGGYVLDFTDPAFRAFFAEHKVDIDADRFQSDGTSKAKRLRSFLRQALPPLSGEVLASLLEHRAVSTKLGATSSESLTRYREIARRLGGQVPDAKAPEASPLRSEEDLLALVFRPEMLIKLPLQVGLAELLADRMSEARRCIESGAYLSAVVLGGSVLEGICLGIGLHAPERVNRAFSAQYNKPAPKLHEWRLQEWIIVLERLGDLSPNVSKFGHALRDFRNYIHPSAQLAAKFSPDAHTARISFHIVVAAIGDVTKVHGGST
ncbi:MAG: hypothetical protein IV100_06965 [Myxococcales bacterium]|nr:hypothetical protein [Myxococcales bacterium]